MSPSAHQPQLGADPALSQRRDWLLVYVVVACCVAVAVGVILVAAGVL